MKKVLFTLFMFFIIPFSHVFAFEEVNGIDYTVEYSSLSQENSSVYINQVNEVIDRLNSEGYKFIVTITPYNGSNSPENIGFSFMVFDNTDNINIELRSRKGFVSGPLVRTFGEEYTFLRFSADDVTYDNFMNLYNSGEWVYSHDYTSFVNGSVNDNGDFIPYEVGTTTRYFPYYANFDIPVYSNDDYPLDFKVNTEYGEVSILDNLDVIYYRDILDGTISDYFLPEVSYEVVSKAVDEETDVITALGVDFSFSEIDFYNYKYEYSFDNGKNWVELIESNLNEDNKFSYHFATNTDVIFKISLKDDSSIYRTFSFNINGIGKVSDYYGDILDETYGDVVGDGDLSVGSSIGDVLKAYTSTVKENFPIIFQIGDVINMFSNHSSYNATCMDHDSGTFETISNMGWSPVDGTALNRDYCIPSVTVDFSFIGINEKYVVIDFTSFNKYRSIIFTFIQIVVGALTFFKVVRILGVTFKR